MGQQAEDETDDQEIEDALETETADEQESVDTPETEDSNDDEVEISLGEESPPQEEATEAPRWVKDLRKSHRELQKKNRELEAKLNTQAAPQPVTLGKKPTLEDCDYDEDKFVETLTAWHERKRVADEAEQVAKRQQAEASKEWQAKLDSYAKKKAALKVRDFDESEAVVEEYLSVSQQAILLNGADMPAELVYALGKNPKEAKKLAEIKDPVKFAFAVAKLEATSLKVNRRNAPPEPDRPVRSSAPSSGAVDTRLERLREEARRTNDYAKVMEYKRSQKRA